MAYHNQMQFTHDRYAEEMKDRNSYGRQAMDILKQKLADADANEELSPYPMMPTMSQNSHAVQASSSDANGTTSSTSSSDFAVADVVQHDIFSTDADGANGLYEASSVSQQQVHYQGNMPPGPNNARTVAAPASHGTNGGNGFYEVSSIPHQQVYYQGNMPSGPNSELTLVAPPAFPGTNGGNGSYEASSLPQQQVYNQGNRPSGSSSALTVAAPAFHGTDGGRDIFSNDHLSSEIAPLEDPAEALALSQSQVPIEIRNRRSRQLNLLTCGPNQLPTPAVALHPDNFPFVDGPRLAQPTPAYGVIKLCNVPESTRRCDILAIVGRNSKVLNDNQEPVHIIIERVNAATRDAYVEFIDEKAAVDVIERFDKAKSDFRGPRLAGHPVSYELSSQASLMTALFPQARGVEWIGATPNITPDDQVEFSWERFKAFITAEEMTCLVKHAEQANKSPRCPQRAYEVMISSLRKMPWYMTDQITVFQRFSMYDATIRMIRSLQKQIRYGNHAFVLNEQLLERLWISAMLCYGFTVFQKNNIASLVKLTAERIRDFNMPRFSQLWAHTYSLVPRPGVPLDVLEWYIAIIRETTTEEVERLPPSELNEVRRQAGSTALYWGYYWKVLRLNDLRGPDFDNMSLGEMARREFYVTAGILTHAFGGQLANLGPQQSQSFAPVVPSQQVNGGQQSNLSGQGGQ